MENIKKFYENTKDAMPHNNIKKFIEMQLKNGNAVDLGCGAGRDTIFLIKNYWNVTAIDRENTKDIIEKKLNSEELKRFKFVCQNFEKIKLEKNDLVVSNFSISFCNKKCFNEFWDKIVDSIKNGRILRWEFFWFKRFMGINKRQYGIFIQRTSFKSFR